MKNICTGTSMWCPGLTRCNLMEFRFLQSKADLFDIKHLEQVVRLKATQRIKMIHITLMHKITLMITKSCTEMPLDVILIKLT